MARSILGQLSLLRHDMSGLTNLITAPRQMVQGPSASGVEGVTAHLPKTQASLDALQSIVRQDLPNRAYRCLIVGNVERTPLEGGVK